MSDYLTKNMEEKFDNEEALISMYAYENNIEYKLIDNQLIVLTDMAYWKITYLADWDCFVLYHGNSIPDDVNPEKYVDADYHYQKDTKQSDSIMKLLTYIRLHDDFRYRMIENVESMPRRTKKQKEKYWAVKRKEKAYGRAIELQVVSAVALANSLSIAV